MGGLAAALNKTMNEGKLKDKLPDDEPLYTNAARLMLLLKEEQVSKMWFRHYMSIY